MLDQNEADKYCEDEPNSYGAGMLLSFIAGALIAIAMVWGISMLPV
ncbi:hypothetical protein [Aneurinibacillus sp. REN35]